MPKLITLFVLFFAITCSNENLDEDLAQSNCESTFEGDVILSTQEEVNDFASFGYCHIEGNLTIGPSDINLEETDIIDVSELNAIISIRDTLNIWKNPGLSNLTGLESLESLSALYLHGNGLNDISAFENINAQLYSLTISENPGLTNLSGLENLTVITEQLNILGNSNLITLVGLDNLRTIGSLLLSSNLSLSSVSDLQGSIITEGLIVQGCNFTSLDGISVNNQLEILALNNSAPITSIEVLSNLSVVDYFFINQMDGLTSLEVFNNLVTVNDLSILSNDNLVSLNGLNNLQAVENTTISNNNVLVNYCALENLFNNGNYGEVTIEDNSFNPTVQDIIEGNCEETPCDNGTYEGNVVLTTQQEIDDFGAMCYSRINGSLTIGIVEYNVESNISSLEGLSSLVAVVGGLTLTQMPDLPNLSGLHNLNTISGNLDILRCHMLTDFSELSNLTDPVGNIWMAIVGNASLNSLNGLNGINNIAGLAIGLNHSLLDLNGLGFMDVEGIIQIELSNGLISLEGLNFTDNTVHNIVLNNLESITSMSGLEGLHSISNRLSMIGNGSLQSMEGLENLTSVNSIGIHAHDNLETLSGLNGLTNVNQGISIGFIEGNTSLSDYCALENLLTNGTFGGVTIENNAYNPTVQDIIDGNCAQ
ncbi:MAG: hypothetical protein KJP09_01860 [Bacteroidia bacterium]|nr:hypothetical protein [Bacteroidia bacterium]